MSKTDGGVAFPNHGIRLIEKDGASLVISAEFEAVGMSLRDYFAAKAMAAYVASEGPASDEDGDFVAKYAYEIADAMLKARA